MLAQSRQGAEGAASWLYPLILPGGVGDTIPCPSRLESLV